LSRYVSHDGKPAWTDPVWELAANSAAEEDMRLQDQEALAKALLADGKGILAGMDCGIA
jgi:hypothetical protein